MTPAARLKEAVWNQIVRLAGADPEFRRRLEADPSAVLRASEVDVPDGIRFVFVEAEASEVEAVVARSQALTVYVPIPMSRGDLDDANLEEVVGGAGSTEPSLAVPLIPPNLAAAISLEGSAQHNVGEGASHQKS